MNLVPPSFDRELVSAAAALAATASPTLAGAEIVALRAANASGILSDETLARGGTVTVRELTVPGSPDVPLLLCRPPPRRDRSRSSTSCTAGAR